MLECPIMLLQLTFFLCRKPITGTGQKFLLQLGIDLLMFDMSTVYLVFYLNAEKTPTAGRIGKQVETIARTNDLKERR